MKKKSFTIRVDLESDKGIKEGTPRLLDLLKKYNMKASFYVSMGGESDIIDFLKYRKKLQNAGERRIKVWSFWDKIRILIFPKDFVKSNKKILDRILEEGHELGIHGWKHREWTRGFNKINKEEQIKKAIDKYLKMFGKKAISFSSPGFNTNEEVLQILEKEEIMYISDIEGMEKKKIGNIINVPITILGKNNMPFIEYYEGEGKSDEEIFEKFKELSKNKRIISFYMHGLFEARFKLKLLEEIFKFINRKKIKNKRIIDY
jgi:peptidoglycan/xylan/chitin deacetylase (PgdA/CDA1 family)